MVAPPACCRELRGKRRARPNRVPSRLTLDAVHLRPDFRRLSGFLNHDTHDADESAKLTRSINPACW